MYRYFSFNDYDLFNVGYVFFCNDKTPSYSPMNHHAKKSILLFLININVNEFISSFGWPEQKEQVNFLSVFFFWHLPCLSVHILILTKKNPKISRFTYIPFMNIVRHRSTDIKSHTKLPISTRWPGLLK